MGWETIFYFYQKWVDRNFSIIAKLWHSENFAGIAKISLCRCEIHCSPILDPAAFDAVAIFILFSFFFFFIFSFSFLFLFFLF